MTDFDATQPVPEQADLNKDLGPSAGAALANSAMVPMGAGTGPMRPVTPSFTPPPGSVVPQDNTALYGQITNPGSFHDKFAGALNSPEGSALAASGPGGLMKAMVAAGIDAMREKAPQPDAGQRAGGIVDRFFAPLAGASGAIGGAGNVAAARIAQTNADQKKKLDEFNEQHKQKMEDIKEGVNMALSNAQMLHSQFLLHKGQGEEQDKNIADGKEAVALLKKQPTPGVPVMEDVTADEIKRGIEQHTKDPNTGIDMTKMTPYATGKKEVGTDENGNPRYQNTYTIMRVPPSTSITDPAMAKKLFPEAKGLDNISAETPLVVPTSLYNARFQSSETSAANKAVMAKQATEAAEAQGKEAEAIEYSNFDGQTVWSRALSDAYKSNPGLPGAAIAMKAYENLQKDNIDPATGKPKYPHLQDDVKKAYGEKNWDTMMSEDQKYHDKLEEQKQAAIEKQKALTVEVSNNRIPLTPEIAQQIAQLPEPQQRVLKQYDSNTQATLMGIAFGNGDIDLEKNFPSRGTMKGSGGLTTQTALGVIHQLNPDWKETTYQVKRDMYKSATAGKLADQATSLNNFIGHAAEAQRINNTFYNTDPKLFKMVFNKLADAGYGTEQVALGEAIDVVNAEFNTMIKSGYAPTTDEIQAQHDLVSRDSTVGQINAALKVMGHMGGVRANSMNERYRTATGGNFPNLIYQDNVDDARAIGINPDRFNSGGVVANSQTGQTTNINQPIQQRTAPAQVPGGKFAVRVNNQIVGYADDAKGTNYTPLQPTK